MTPWTWTVAALLGEPAPPLPALPGRVITCRDAPLSADELAGCESATELALCAGISRQAAHQRMKKADPLPDPQPDARDALHTPGKDFPR